MSNVDNIGIDVSIIIVNYNTCGLLRDCIRSIYDNTSKISYEVIVSDNGSSDGSVQMLKREFLEVIVVENGENLGFGAANNRALRVARGKYIFYLNSDTILLNNAVFEFYRYWEDNGERENIGCLGCWLVDADGHDVQSTRGYPTSAGVFKSLTHIWLWTKMGRPLDRPDDALPVNVEHEDTCVDGYITGAAMFLVNDANAVFDERYFMYAEESDLQYNNFHRKNKVVKLLKAPRIVHLVGGSDGGAGSGVYDFNKKTNRMLWESNVKYLQKNCGSGPLFGIILWMLGRIYGKGFCKDNL